jgi:hypothetical protein
VERQEQFDLATGNAAPGSDAAPGNERPAAPSYTPPPAAAEPMAQVETSGAPAETKQD